MRFFNNNQFPTNIPSYVNINNSPGEQYFTASFVICFPTRMSPLGPQPPNVTIFFPHEGQNPVKKFLLLNSVSSAVDLEPLVRVFFICQLLI